MNIKMVVKNKIYKFLELIERQISAFRDRKLPKPIYLINQNAGKIKIHVGPGDVNLQGWINIDARNMPHVHIVSEDLSFDEFTDGAIDEVYMCHILEHLSFAEAVNTLAKIKVKLKKGGVIRLSVPCFDSLTKIYIGDWSSKTYLTPYGKSLVSLNLVAKSI